MGKNQNEIGALSYAIWKIWFTIKLPFMFLYTAIKCFVGVAFKVVSKVVCVIYLLFLFPGSALLFYYTGLDGIYNFSKFDLKLVKLAMEHMKKTHNHIVWFPTYIYWLLLIGGLFLILYLVNKVAYKKLFYWTGTKGELVTSAIAKWKYFLDENTMYKNKRQNAKNNKMARASMPNGSIGNEMDRLQDVRDEFRDKETFVER